MSIRQKMIWGAILITLVPALIISISLGYLGFSSARDSLQSEAQNKLISIRDAKKDQFELYMENLGNQVQSISSSRTTVAAMQAFNGSFHNYPTSELNITKLRNNVSGYYASEFGAEYKKRNNNTTPVVDEKLRALSDKSIALQYQYISNNASALGSKDELSFAPDGTEYSKHHRTYHKEFRDLANTFGLYDIFLVDGTTGDVVYSVYKELDYATSLIDGPYASSGLGRAFAKANSAGQQNAVLFEDYAQYFPSYNDQAVFLASPIFNGGERIGVLVMQVPIDKINAIMTFSGEWEKSGLGASGETYLVGQDTLLRNESRLWVDDEEAYLQTLQQASLDTTDIVSHDTTIGFQAVKTSVSSAALKGVSGFDIIRDYRDISVLSAYTFVDIFGTRWGLMAEIDEEEAFAPATTLRNKTALIAMLITAIVVGLVTYIAFLMVKTITTPIRILDETVHKIVEGDFEARTGLDSQDELGSLGKSFDSLLDDRIAAGQQAEIENEQLNNSIVGLIRAVSDISKRDFTVRIPVSENVTGAVSDALNLLTSQTSKSLNAMKAISLDVSDVSTAVKSQSDSVLDLAATGRQSVDNTVNTLNQAAEEMQVIASEAQEARSSAEETIKATEDAFDIVNRSATGINAIRDTISETEKRIKRLGERSQEITGIVNIINSIAERTHILALNASMHAASAGEAGRGFAVVADEVQRLAENAREATAEISTLVNNIRVETSDTVSVMNTAISQVAGGTKLAEQAGLSMQAAQKTTKELVDSVLRISGTATKQTVVANQLQLQAVEIQDSTRKTEDEMNEQKVHTDQLVIFAGKLVEQVSVFKLPESST